MKASNILLTKSITSKYEEIKSLDELRRQRHHEFETQGRAIKRYDREVESLEGQLLQLIDEKGNFNLN